MLMCPQRFVLSCLLILSVFCCVSAAQVQQPSSQAPNTEPSASREKKKRLASGVRGFEKYAGRDASSKLIVGAATRGNPNSPPSMLCDRAIEGYQNGNYAEAVRDFKEAIKQHPGWDQARYGLALTYLEMGQQNEAIEEFKEVVKLDSSKELKVLAYYNMGNAYVDLGQYERAVEAYKQAIALSPELSKPHYNLGIAYLALGKQQEAAERFKEAVRLKPEYAEAHFNLGLLALELGNKNEAAAQQQILKNLKSELANRLEALINN